MGEVERTFESLKSVELGIDTGRTRRVAVKQVGYIEGGGGG